MEDSRHFDNNDRAAKDSAQLHRFFVPPQNIRPDTASLTRNQARQIANVLRLKPGRRIVVLDNTGAEYRLLLTEVAPDRVRGRIIEKKTPATEPTVRITLCQSLLARTKFELVLQKCTELGVARFIPIITERSVVRDTAAFTSAKKQRWNRIITEAAEQSHRARIPELASPLTFEQALKTYAEFACSLIASTAPDAPALNLSLTKPPTEEIALFIGPEGGFTDNELKLALENNATSFTLGPTILRTETAAIAATAVILHQLTHKETVGE